MGESLQGDEMDLNYKQPLEVIETEIPDVLTVNLTLHSDNRGYFKENFNQQKMEAEGLPGFFPASSYMFSGVQPGESVRLPAAGNRFLSTGIGEASVQLEDDDGQQLGVVDVRPDTAVFVPEGLQGSIQAKNETSGVCLADRPAGSEVISVQETSIPGLQYYTLASGKGMRLVWDKTMDSTRGFQPVQNNFSFNTQQGVTRGIHAEPWDKYISVTHGEVFAAIVDLRAGDDFGTTEIFHLDPNKAIYVPQGCGNSFQALTENVVYTYLVNKHWSPEAEYTMLNLADPEVAVNWPIPLSEATLSDKDKNHPFLENVIPMEVNNE